MMFVQLQLEQSQTNAQSGGEAKLILHLTRPILSCTRSYIRAFSRGVLNLMNRLLNCEYGVFDAPFLLAWLYNAKDRCWICAD